MSQDQHVPSIPLILDNVVWHFAPPGQGHSHIVISEDGVNMVKDH